MCSFYTCANFKFHLPPTTSLPLEEILLSAALQLVLLLAPALVALSARRVCLTFLRLLLLLPLLLCIIFHTPKYHISYRIVPYRTRPDKCNRAATLKQRASSALDIPPRLHSGPQSQAAVPSARLWRAPIDDDPTALPWPFALALLPPYCCCCCCCLCKKKFKRPPTIWRNVNVPANVISFLRRRRRCRLLLEEYSYSHSHSCLQSYCLHTL